MSAGAGRHRPSAAAGVRTVSDVEIGLVAQLGLTGAAILVGLFSTPRRRALLAGICVAAVGAAGAATGGVVLAGGHVRVAVSTALPFDQVVFEPNPLGGFFMIVAGLVSAVIAVYAIGYVHGAAASRTSWMALAVFVLAMQMVPAAGDAVSFLLMWELMALSSTALVLTEHANRSEVRSAALWYAVMTHLSFGLILLGFAVLAAGHASDFAATDAVDPGSPAASVAFVLLVLGFATKAGIVPMHVWLPRAHPAAPSHVSAAMSAAMVKMGVYGVLLVVLRLLPDGPHWWGVLLIGLGAVSAVYGILQASVATDLKRLLAYSTTENIGLIYLAIGTGILLRSYGVSGPADVAIGASLLLVASHAAFKTTLFLAAGSVLHATGERDLDRLGGLVSRMPITTAAFGIGALGAAALPVTCGFVAEWALLRSLIQGAQPENRLVAVAMPVSVAVVALTAGIALLTFVKGYGMAFLARPRGPGADAAQESGLSMRIAMSAGAAFVVLLGLAPGVMASAAATAAGLDGVGSVDGVGVDLSGVDALLEPPALATMAILVAIPVVVASWVAARRRPRRSVEIAWGCGGVRVSPRMQYTATSYAEPLSRVFDDALRPERDLEVTHASESRYLVERVRFRHHLDDVVEVRVYRPVIRAVDRLGILSRRLQNGSIHRYLGYSFIALVAVLVVVSL
jgi:formate hydrogenlyase subunit 3/multisubunit Na+/H+ antiporter MnhD subunit